MTQHAVPVHYYCNQAKADLLLEECIGLKENIGEFNKQLYEKFFLTTEEIQACREGYIYVHDMSARRDTMNCCLFDVASVLSGGFEMGNIWYNEPKTLDVAFDVIGDIVMAAASQQYGGFTVAEVDKILAPYAQKTFERQYTKYIEYKC